LRSKSTGSNQSGLKSRIASRQFKNAECFRIPKNPKIFVSVAIENGFLQNESHFNKRPLVILNPPRLVSSPLRGEDYDEGVQKSWRHYYVTSQWLTVWITKKGAESDFTFRPFKSCINLRN
jgi:hypothetical protein